MRAFLGNYRQSVMSATNSEHNEAISRQALDQALKILTDRLTIKPLNKFSSSKRSYHFPRGSFKNTWLDTRDVSVYSTIEPCTISRTVCAYYVRYQHRTHDDDEEDISDVLYSCEDVLKYIQDIIITPPDHITNTRAEDCNLFNAVFTGAKI